MSIAVAGIDHSTCPVSVRERTVVEAGREAPILRWLNGCEGIEGAMILSTCARTEIYVAAEIDSVGALERARQVLRDINADSLPFIWTLEGREATRHAFRVTAGLESQVVGEAEITGQVRGAVQTSRSHGTLGLELNDLFRAGVACSRRLRRETNLGDSDSSVASAARLIYESDHVLPDASVLVIGSGRIARILLEEFSGAKRLVVAARTHASAHALAQRRGCEVMLLDEALGSLGHFDVVCSATRARQPLLTVAALQAAAPLVVFDVSVPRNVEMMARQLPGITLFDIDDVRLLEASTHLDMCLVGSIIDSEIHDFEARSSQRDVGPIIESLRVHVDSVRTQEIERLGSKLDSFDDRQRAIVETLTQRLIDRMFHHLVIRMKLAALSDPELIRAAEFFFAHGDAAIFPEMSRQEPAVTESRA